MKILLTLLMVIFLVSCTDGDNVTDSGGITVDPIIETYSYTPVDTIHGNLTYAQFAEALKQGNFLDNNYRDCTATLQNYHISRNNLGPFQTWIRVNDDYFTREINNYELDYLFDSLSSVTSEYLDVVIMLNEITESSVGNPLQVAPAAFYISTASGVDYIIDLNISILQNPVRMFDNEMEEGYDLINIYCYN